MPSTSGYAPTSEASPQGRNLTILEIDFRNPPWAAAHCPPSSAFVHHLHGGRSASVDICYHPS